MNKLGIYLLLGRILRAGAGREDDELHGILSDEMVDWEKFTALADRNLILQALYPKMERLGLQSFVPPELMEHLRLLHDMNAERNRMVIAQSERITTVLNRAGIQPVFMKGVGHILEGLYPDAGERILHDIDILVEPDLFDRSVEVLQHFGYRGRHTYDPDIHGRSKHYPILFKNGEPAFLEVHNMPVGRRYGHLLTAADVFAEKVPLKSLPGSFVMSDRQKIRHNFIHSQLEHFGHYYARIFMRNLYDLLLLSGKADIEEVLYGIGSYRRQVAGYLDVFYRLFDIERPDRRFPKPFLHLYSKRYHMSMEYPLLGRMNVMLLRLNRSFIIHPFLAVFDRGRRKVLLRKIADPAWYRKQVRYYRRFFGKR